jgi:hypothetical protein
LILCRRQISQLVDLNLNRWSNIILGPQDDETWNLDVRIGTENKDHVFLLTNRKIFWIQLVAHEPNKNDKFFLEYEVLVSVRHFRDPKDMTLKMKILEADGGA